MFELDFTVAGEPQGKGRARAFRRGSFIGHYTPEKTRSYEGMVRFAAQTAMAGKAPVGEPVIVTVFAHYSIPKSFSRAKRYDAEHRIIKPTKRPDLDNIVKACTDAMNGVVFRDDSQIVSLYAAKEYSTHPGVTIKVEAHLARSSVQARAA